MGFGSASPSPEHSSLHRRFLLRCDTQSVQTVLTVRFMSEDRNFTALFTVRLSFVYCSFTVHLKPKDSKYTLTVKNGKTRKYTLSAFIESQVLPIPGLELRHSGEGGPLERLGG